MIDEMADKEDARRTDLKDAMCIYGGSRCSFDGTIRFMQDAMQNNNTHMFIAGGYFTNLPHRHSLYTLPSAPALTTNMVLLYNQANELNGIDHAFRTITGPFMPGAWIMVEVFGLALLSFFAIFYFRFRPRDNALAWFFNERRNEHGLEATTWFFLKTAGIVFFAGIVLLYEVGIAVNIFRGGDPFVEDIEQLKTLDLPMLAVPAGGASEIILKKFTISSKYSDPTEFPWMRVTPSLSETVDLLQKGRAKYVFTFDKFARHVLFEKRLCNQLTLDFLQKQQTGGWYYSNNIPRPIVEWIDKEISEWHLAYVPSSSKYGTRPLDCGSQRKKVDVLEMLLLLVFTVGLLLLLSIISFCFDVRRYGFRRVPTSQDTITIPITISPPDPDDAANLAQADSADIAQGDDANLAQVDDANLATS